MAVVGVSRKNDRHPANVIFYKNHLRQTVDVYAVNPKGGKLLGEKLYPDVASVPGQVDLAVIAVRAAQVPGVLADCARAGAKSAAVISGGFAEVGREDLQDEISAIAADAGMPMLGPNCLGIYAPGYADTFFLPPERMIRPEQGNVALVSQSGGILVDQMIKFADEGVGLSLAVSIGNKAMIRERDLLAYLTEDDKTRVIAFYVEGFGKGEGRAFVHQARDAGKPIIILKAGKSAAGTQAVSSHTAALAGDYNVFSSVMAQFGVVEAKNELELVSFCEALSCYDKPLSGRAAILTGSGGHGAMAVDECARLGIETPALSSALAEKVRAGLSEPVSSIASLKNPIDLTGSAVDDDFVHAVSTLSDSSEVDCVLLLLLPYLPGVTSDLGARLSAVFRRKGKPLAAYVPRLEKYRMLIEGFELNRVPVAPSIDGAVLMVEALRRCAPC
ncbi:MAG: CoA-binding protein [Deltaproteobacteria bacterium]|nr:CoA-binding protein [Deltaproteobacteria bacterium]